VRPALHYNFDSADYHEMILEQSRSAPPGSPPDPSRDENAISVCSRIHAACPQERGPRAGSPRGVPIARPAVLRREAREYESKQGASSLLRVAGFSHLVVLAKAAESKHAEARFGRIVTTKTRPSNGRSSNPSEKPDESGLEHNYFPAQEQELTSQRLRREDLKLPQMLD